MASASCYKTWKAERPPVGYEMEVYPRQSPTHFFVSPRYLKHIFGEPNSRDDPYRTFHVWDVTDGTDWVHIYNYKDENSFSMRGDSPDATQGVLEFISRSYPRRRATRAHSE